MRLLVGDDVGQAKVIQTSRGIDTTKPTSARATTTSFFPPSRTRPIQHAVTVTYQSRHGLAAVFSKGGHLRIFDPASSPQSPTILFSHTLDVPSETDTLSLGTYNNSSCLYAATAAGRVLFLDLNSGMHDSRSFSSSKLTTFSVLEPTNGLLPAAVAVAAEGKDLEILVPIAPGSWSTVWKSKNVKPNALKLMAPVSFTATTFLPSSTSSFRLLAATKQGQIRIYDTAVSRRPVWSTEASKAEILSVTLHPESDPPTPQEPLLLAKGEQMESARLARNISVVFADYNGAFERWSLTERRSVGLYKGLTGAVLSVQVKNGLVMGTGFGRYLGVWDASSRELLSRVYVKTQGCAVCAIETEDEEKDEQEKEGVEEDAEDVWDGMEEVKGSADERDMTEQLVNIKVKRKKEIANGGGGKKRKVEE